MTQPARVVLTAPAFHVAAFFAVPALTFWTAAGLLGISWHPESLGIWATVGTAAAIGRWAIRKEASRPAAGTPDL